MSDFVLELHKGLCSDFLSVSPCIMKTAVRNRTGPIVPSLQRLASLLVRVALRVSRCVAGTGFLLGSLFVRSFRDGLRLSYQYHNRRTRRSTWDVSQLAPDLVLLGLTMILGISQLVW